MTVGKKKYHDNDICEWHGIVGEKNLKEMINRFKKFKARKNLTFLSSEKSKLMVEQKRRKESKNIKRKV